MTGNKRRVCRKNLRNLWQLSWTRKLFAFWYSVNCNIGITWYNLKDHNILYSHVVWRFISFWMFVRNLSISSQQEDVRVSILARLGFDRDRHVTGSAMIQLKEWTFVPQFYLISIIHRLLIRWAIVLRQ